MSTAVVNSDSMTFDVSDLCACNQLDLAEFIAVGLRYC